MLLGLRLVQSQIADFMVKGGRLRQPDDSGPLELDPYFGTLVSPRSAFPDLEWGRLDVDGIVSAAGIAVVRPSDRQPSALARNDPGLLGRMGPGLNLQA
jgi:hypothetical protein